MREITPNLTPELENHVGTDAVDAAQAFGVATYADLVNHCARLAYLNKDHLLFFRGQARDYKSKAGSSTIYPTIYRDYLPQREINYRFDVLNEASLQLKELFKRQKVQGYQELARKKYVQWSVLQHYQVCSTPLLDITHSIRVACSFAQIESTDSNAFVFVFGLPYATNRISINSEHDVVLIRLLSICPPDALRPYFQEGYMTGTEDLTNEYESKTELDFKNRLIAKFELPTGQGFWGAGFSEIPRSVLYPRDDHVEELCKSIELELKEELLPGALGEFIRTWIEFEYAIISLARKIDPDIHTARSALKVLSQSEIIDPGSLLTFNEIRRFRNLVVHEPQKIHPDELNDYMNRIDLFREHELGPIELDQAP